MVGKEVTVELKNDLAVTGVLHSVDQYLNIKLAGIRVADPARHPHMASVRNCFIRGSVVRYVVVRFSRDCFEGRDFEGLFCSDAIQAGASRIAGKATLGLALSVSVWEPSALTCSPPRTPRRAAAARERRRGDPARRDAAGGARGVAARARA